jgi:hypothetical protein
VVKAQRQLDGWVVKMPRCHVVKGQRWLDVRVLGVRVEIWMRRLDGGGGRGVVVVLLLLLAAAAVCSPRRREANMRSATPSETK